MPPCRQFTPKLVEFVKSLDPSSGVEVALVSSDQDSASLLKYMNEEKMPWGGMLRKGGGLKDLCDGFKGIPCLRLFDGEGRILADSVDGSGKYLGASSVLDDLKKRLK